MSARTPAPSPPARFAFCKDGQEIIAIEDRSKGVFSIVGVPTLMNTESTVTLVAPVAGKFGFARASYKGKTGVCFHTDGAEVTRRLIVAAHNSGRAAAVIEGNYLFIDLVIA